MQNKLSVITKNRQFESQFLSTPKNNTFLNENYGFQKLNHKICEKPILRQKSKNTNRFFDIQYDRIKQIKHKYRNQSNNDNYREQIKNKKYIDGEFKNIPEKTENNVEKSDNQTYKIDFYQPFNPNTFRFENKMLNDYVSKLKQKVQQANYSLQNQHMVESELIVYGQSDENNKLNAKIDQQQKIDSNNQKLKIYRVVKQDIKKGQKINLPKSYTQKSAQKYNQELQEEVNAFVLMLQNQIKLDIQFRKLRQLIPKVEFEDIAKRVQRINGKINRQKLILQNCQINHFGQSQKPKLSTNELILGLIKSFEDSQTHFIQYLYHKMDLKIINKWIQIIDIGKNGNITTGNIITDINIRTGINYRNRDIIRLTNRMGSKKQFTKLQLTAIFANVK